MALSRFSQIGKSIETDGKFHYQYLYKATVPSAVTAGLFVDLNQTAGVPKYNPFVGSSLTATTLTGAGNFGIYPGNYISGSTKHLLRWQLTETTASVPNLTYLCDYLMFYSLIDCDDDTGPQDMDNATPLSRYTDGAGVRGILVATAPMVGTTACTVSYTNQAGTSGRTTTFNLTPATAIGICASSADTAGLGVASATTPFFPLASGDSGIRSVQSVTMAASGAGGFVCLLLVKPLAQLSSLENGVVVEKNFGIENQMLPEIKAGAHLNLLTMRGTTTVGSMRGEFVFINS
jgi:hypothetical protein